MKPSLPEDPGTRRALAVLAVLAAAKAAGLVLLADALATGIAQLAAGGELDAPRALAFGLSGALLRGGAAWATQHAALRAGLGAKERLRARLVGAGVAGVRNPQGPGAIAALAGRGLDGLDNYYTRYLPALVAAAVVPALVGARILFADWVSALVVLLTLPLVPLFMALIGLHTQDRVREAADGLERISGHLLELAQGLPALIGVRRAGGRGRAVARASEDYRATTLGTLRTAFLSGLALELIATISVAVVAVFIGVRLVHGGIGLETGLLALILAPECFAPLREVGAAFHASEDGVEAMERSKAVLAGTGAAEGTDDGGGRSGTGTAGASHPSAEPPAPGTALCLEGLAVRFGAGAPPALQARDLVLPAGGVEVLDTASGSGKSTLLHAVLGRLPASAVVDGALAVDRSATAWIPQHPRFTEETVAAELALHAGRPLGEDEVRGLLAETALTGLAGRRPDECSPGELRRLAVARALARIAYGAPCALLIADEPTAHLDPESAAAVRAAMVRALPGRAVLVATHDRVLAAELRSADPRASRGASPRGTARPFDAVQAAGPGASTALPAPAAAAETSSTAGWADDDGPRGTAGRAFSLVGGLPWGRGGLALGIGYGTLALAFAAALTAVSGWLIVTASHQPPMLHLMVAIVGVRFFGMGRAVLRYLEQLAVHNALLRWAGTVRERLWDALVSQPRHWGRITRSGAALGHLVAEVDEVRDTVPRVLVPPLAGIATWALAATAIALWAPAGLGAAVALGVAGWVLLPVLVIAVERRSGRALAGHRIALGTRVPTLLAAAVDLGGNGAARHAVERFAREDAAATSKLKRAGRADGIGQGGAVLLASAAAVAALCSVGGVAGTAEAAAIAALTLLALGEPVASTAAAARQLPQLGDGLRRVAGVLDDPHAAAGRPLQGPTTADGAPPRALAAAGGPLRFRLSGGAGGWGDGPDVFADLDLEAAPGRWTLVTGPSGTGKSTLLAVLLGALPLRSGRLEARTGTGPWRAAAADDFARVAWCPQEAHLFDSSVRSNLGLGRPEHDAPTDAELVDALGAVGLGSWFSRQPEGLATRIGSGGHHLSGGQRQRLAAARALVARSDVVLLDEPTAHLGQDEAADLIADLRRGLSGRSVVLVTHDPRLAAPGDAVTALGAASPAAS
ncbi:thiol reductant ABC exporter subunit CydC [Zafaria sp. J156]|uniref:thiol reductant ABC exporter subunit CydC n=1 Tax=Zafaria sp. J156 TaxID=3116490 RepID=UPI002E771BD3|nr:thiol reductant ABC exporter subunit CydC [Zafaria sp. J156]MEE1620244.1 thiol reductant ABC exporter subunit CydC [Zafaria sp. J156]